MNDRQRRFAIDYAKSLNATQAAIAAGYSPKTAKQIGSRLLTHVAVRAEIAGALERAEVDAGWLLRRLTELAEVDVLDIFDPLGRLRPLDEIPVAARRLIGAIEYETRWEGSGKDAARVDVTKIKLLDRLRVLDGIGKHVAVGAYREAERGRDTLLVIRDYTGREPPKSAEIDVTPHER